MPLLVPEIGNDPLFARYFYDVLGAQAVGIVPFGIDLHRLFKLPAGRAQHRRGHRSLSRGRTGCWRRWRVSGRG